jgi:thiamine biosynthesis lipoprotein
MSRWRTLRFEFQAMASACSLQIDGRDEQMMRKAAAQAITEVHRIESKFSRYRAGSVVSRINRNAGLDLVAIDAETNALLDFADQLYALSEGLFDITSGVLRRAWDFRAALVPTWEQLNAVLPLVGWQQVERRGDTVRLLQPGMELDFGGFGKEYAADRAVMALQRHGIRHALVNLGGDLHALGARGLPESAGAPWQIEIQHPRPASPNANETIAVLQLTHGGLATSGDYERYFVKDGQRYCHVLNPLTGWPVTHWQSVSIVAANATSAGALATIAMLKGPEATAWLHTQDVRYLAIAQDGELIRSSAPALPPSQIVPQPPVREQLFDRSHTSSFPRHFTKEFSHAT